MSLDPPTVFVMILLYWNSGGNGQGNLAVAEFQTKERCLQAAEIAEAKFSGRFTGTLYTVCVAK
jgi:hypothetical protein